MTVSAPSPRLSTANPTRSTVQSKETPGAGSTWLDGPIGISGESATATPTARRAPRSTAQSGPSMASDVMVDPIGPQGAQDIEILTVGPDPPAYGLPGDEQDGEAGDDAEHAEAIASGLVARSTWPSTTDVRWKL